jgi:hypothetical protein
MMNLLRKAFFATKFFLPPRHQDTKKHKEMNINSIILVNPSCHQVFFATKAPRHQEIQRDEYQFNNLGESFVPPSFFFATKTLRHQEAQRDEYQFNNLGESFVPPSFFFATKSPRHQEIQRDEYQFNNLGESFVSWCLGGILTEWFSILNSIQFILNSHFLFNTNTFLSIGRG